MDTAVPLYGAESYPAQSESDITERMSESYTMDSESGRGIHHLYENGECTVHGSGN